MTNSFKMKKVCHIGKISPNRSSKALRPDQPWQRGAATISINEWFKYFNVRSNLIDLVAGNEYIVKIKATQHTASPGIQSVSPEKRYCHFEDERESTSILYVFQIIHDILGFPLKGIICQCVN